MTPSVDTGQLTRKRIKSTNKQTKNKCNKQTFSGGRAVNEEKEKYKD